LQAPTIAQLAEVLRKEHWVPSWSSLVPIRPGGSKPPLFLMHSHGGNVLEYYPLANRMDADQPVYALQARGLDGHIVKGQSLEEMAAAYVDELMSLQPEGPYFLGGFCFGGLLALEAAQQLSSAGEEVALVIMIQTTNPSFARFRPDTTLYQQWWHRMSKRVDLERENLSYRGKGYIYDRFRHTWNVALARTSIALDKLIGNGHASPEDCSTRYVLESLAIEHDRVFYEYVPRPYRGDAILLRATKQLVGLMADSYLGWKDIFQGNLDICDVPGHQQNMLIEPNVVRLAEELDARLRDAQRRRMGGEEIYSYVQSEAQSHV
jgi:thioesterase domain-containing protein